jgi:hypothetical protein
MSQLTSPVYIWLRCVHAESELVEDTEVSRARGSGDTRLGIVNEKRVLFSQKRWLAIWSVLSVPYNLCLLRRHVDCDGVCGLVCRARGQDIDGGGGDGERRVVPSECNVLANSVELLAGNSVGSDHGDTSGW